jgi:hypothetical protein
MALGSTKRHLIQKYRRQRMSLSTNSHIPITMGLLEMHQKNNSRHKIAYNYISIC